MIINEYNKSTNEIKQLDNNIISLTKLADTSTIDDKTVSNRYIPLPTNPIGTTVMGANAYTKIIDFKEREPIFV